MLKHGGPWYKPTCCGGLRSHGELSLLGHAYGPTLNPQNQGIPNYLMPVSSDTDGQQRGEGRLHAQAQCRDRQWRLPAVVGWEVTGSSPRWGMRMAPVSSSTLCRGGSSRPLLASSSSASCV